MSTLTGLLVVSVEKGSASERDLKSLIEAHVANTDSARGKMILEQWDTYLPKFVEPVSTFLLPRS